MARESEKFNNKDKTFLEKENAKTSRFHHNMYGLMTILCLSLSKNIGTWQSITGHNGCAAVHILYVYDLII